MPETKFRPGSRRAMLGMSGPALAGLALLATSPSVAKAAGAEADAALISLCNEHAKLSVKNDGYDDDENAGLISEKEREKAQEPIDERQREIEIATYDLRASTMEGLRARVRMILAYSPTILENQFSGDVPDKDMVIALLADITAIEPI